MKKEELKNNNEYGLAPYHFLKKSGKGFTLLETVIYLGLYALIFTGALAGVYSIFESSARNQTKAMVSEEGTYLAAKIDWVLGGAQSIDYPPSGGIDNRLSVTRYGSGSSTSEVIISNGTMTLDGVRLNNTNTSVVLVGADRGFVHEEASEDDLTPESVRASFTLMATTSQGMPYAQSFGTVRYLRK